MTASSTRSTRLSPPKDGVWWMRMPTWEWPHTWLQENNTPSKRFMAGLVEGGFGIIGALAQGWPQPPRKPTRLAPSLWIFSTAEPENSSGEGGHGHFAGRPQENHEEAQHGHRKTL